MYSESKTNKLVIAEWITLAGLFITAFAYMHRDTQRMATEIHERTLAQETRTDALYEQFQFQNQTQVERTDRLYEMFIELVRERK